MDKIELIATERERSTGYGALPLYVTEHKTKPGTTHLGHGVTRLDVDIDPFDGAEWTLNGWLWIDGRTWEAMVCVGARGELTYTSLMGGLQDKQ